MSQNPENNQKDNYESRLKKLRQSLVAEYQQREEPSLPKRITNFFNKPITRRSLIITALTTVAISPLVTECRINHTPGNQIQNPSTFLERLKKTLQSISSSLY